MPGILRVVYFRFKEYLIINTQYTITWHGILAMTLSFGLSRPLLELKYKPTPHYSCNLFIKSASIELFIQLKT
jgi:hypothetical protein